MESAQRHVISGVSTRRSSFSSLSAATLAVLLLASCAAKTTLPGTPSDTPPAAVITVVGTAAATSSALNTSLTVYSTTVSQDRVTRVRPVVQKYTAQSPPQLSQYPVADLVTPGDGYTYRLGPAILEAQLFSEVLVTGSSATEVVLSFKLNSDGLAELLWESASAECAGSRKLCPLQEVAVFSGDVFAFRASLQELSVSPGVLQLGTKLDAVRAEKIAQIFS